MYCVDSMSRTYERSYIFMLLYFSSLCVNLSSDVCPYLPNERARTKLTQLAKSRPERKHVENNIACAILRDGEGCVHVQTYFIMC